MMHKTTRSSKSIPAHYGMSDYYRYFCKMYPELDIDKKVFNKIITEYNKEICNIILEDLEIQLPHRLGKLELLKQKRGVYVNDEGKVINTNPVDWKKTNHLWENNQEAKDKKILIRHTNKHTGGYVFSINYNKKNAIFKNKSVYFFKAVRDLARGINERIMDYSKPKYDTYEKK